MVEILVPISFFAMIVIIVVGPRYLRSQEKQKMQETLRAAIEKGQPLPPEVVDALSRDVKITPPASPQRDLRRGIVWLGAGIGLAVFGLVMGYSEPDWTFHLVAIAAFPAFIGLAFIVVALLGREKK